MNRVLEIILSLTIAGTVIAFGGVQPLAYSLMEVAIFAAFLWLLLEQTKQGRIELRLPLWPALFAFLVLLQVVPLPLSWVARISPARHFDSPVASLAPLHHSWTTLSIYPHASLVGFIKVIAYLCAFLLAAHLFDSGTRKSFLVRSLALLGCLEAAYGIIQYLTHNERVLGIKKIYYLGVATGTYINHNHFAGLLEMTLPFLVAYVYYAFQIRSDRRLSGSRSAKGSAGASTARVLLLLFLCATALTGVFFSFSRAGIVSALLSILFVGLLAGIRTRRKAWILGVFAFMACAVGYGVWIGLGPVVERFEAIRETNYLQTEGRITFWEDSLGIIKNYPLTGTGLGTFGLSFRRYQTSWLDLFVDHPHNDYVEVVCETGLVGAVLLFLPIFYLVGKMAQAFYTDTRRFRSATILGCLGSVLAMLLHSLLDFNLQVPANAMVFAVVLGIGYKAACVEREAERKLAAKPQAVPVMAIHRVQ
jgi:O-antigen ligase